MSLLPRFVRLRRSAGRAERYSGASGMGARATMSSAGCASTCPYSVIRRPASSAMSWLVRKGGGNFVEVSILKT